MRKTITAKYKFKINFKVRQLYRLNHGSNTDKSRSADFGYYFLSYTGLHLINAPLNYHMLIETGGKLQYLSPTRPHSSSKYKK